MDYKKIKKLEKRLYPKYLRQMQDIDSVEEFIEYCECVPEIFFFKSGYMILGDREIIDLALNDSKEFFKAISIIKRKFKNSEISADFREKTSWKLFSKMHNKVEILHTEKWELDIENFYYVLFRIK